MGMMLSADDLLHLEAASRILVSPLSAPNLDVWRRNCMQAVRLIAGAECAQMALPCASSYIEAQNVDAGLLKKNTEFISAAWTGSGESPDPIVKTCHEIFLSGGTSAWDMQAVDRLVGDRHRSSVYYNEVIFPLGATDSYNLFVPTTAGSVLLSCWAVRGEETAGQYLPLFRALLPSLSAGIDAIKRFVAHRQALDELAEPLIFFGEDGGERHRNASLLRLLEEEPERAVLLAEVNRLAAGLHPLGNPRTRRSTGHLVHPGSVEVPTATARYTLRGALLPAGSFGGDVSVMVSVSKERAAALPTADELRARYALTAREAEVAVLLAEGLSNEDIAARLYLSPHTARRHTANIFEKLEVGSRKALALRFLRERTLRA